AVPPSIRWWPTPATIASEPPMPPAATWSPPAALSRATWPASGFPTSIVPRNIPSAWWPWPRRAPLPFGRPVDTRRSLCAEAGQPPGNLPLYRGVAGWWWWRHHHLEISRVQSLQRLGVAALPAPVGGTGQVHRAAIVGQDHPI